MAKTIDWARRAESAFKYPTFYYQSFRLLDGDLLTAQEQRQELSRLLSIARKRQRRLQKSEFSESWAARVDLPRMKDLKTPREVSRALADIAMLIRSRRSTVSGERAYQAEVSETLKATFSDVAEVDFTAPEFNWKQFGQFMQQMKKSGKAKEGADSARVVRMYFVARKIGLTPAGLRDNYEEFVKRQDEMLQLYRQNPYGRRNTSGAAMLERLDKLSK